MFHDFVDVEVSADVVGNLEKWCVENSKREWLTRRDIFDQHSDGHKIQRVYFASKKDADKFKEEFDDFLYRADLTEEQSKETILAMMEGTAQRWEDEGNLRMAEEIRDQIQSKFFQNFARAQIKKREENGKKG